MRFSTAPNSGQPGRRGFQPHRIQANPVGAVFNRAGVDSKLPNYFFNLHATAPDRHSWKQCPDKSGGGILTAYPSYSVSDRTIFTQQSLTGVHRLVGPLLYQTIVQFHAKSRCFRNWNITALALIARFINRIVG